MNCSELQKWRKPLEIKEKPPFLAAFNPWRCGESNPGPMTEPSVFYVRSLLAVRRFFCPHRCRRQLMASISTVKVPCRPCGSAGKASLLNDAQHPPKDEGE
ncbi:DEAD/DEAH box helicase-like [Bifidobacterium adolescentis ATCC 15703]|uniref:DEAD/DEAH box helicase-like n=1 Tax=Bifidobacterium adolescentis (strain ATCC 15703 / DSM 20083 / NCTC 11814 / E194a) TaxID=367928 RepID=A1A2E5_BIFAA|nr:DEAD/DEAH box helicase-like [Bifidobacterium adolescentis ATCC 15703]